MAYKFLNTEGIEFLNQFFTEENLTLASTSTYQIMTIFVSVIIPIRNEEKYIAKCIDSIITQTYPKESLEVLLVDGQSEDNTKKIIEDYAKKYPYIRVLENPKRIVPTALNIGIKASKGDIIIRLDAHTYYDRDYISKCVETLEKVDAVNVGGPIVTLPGDKTLKAKAIALATSHSFGVGNSKFRTSNKAEYVDTVTFGAFKRGVFDKVGLFNERLSRNQDIEFNLRIRRFGGKIFLNPEIKSYYYNQSTLKGLWRQNFKNGMWNIFTHAASKNPLSIRHYVPLIFVTSLIGSIILASIHTAGIFLFMLISVSYLLTNLFFTFRIGLKHDLRVIAFLPIIFATLHFSYGIGSIFGLLRLRKWVKGVVN